MTQQIFFLMIKINIFWGDLSGISAKTATLVISASHECALSQSTELWNDWATKDRCSSEIERDVRICGLSVYLYMVNKKSACTLPHICARMYIAWVAGRHFKFLAYGSSQLREHSSWFYCEDVEPGDTLPPPKLQDILDGMGDFSQIKVASKYAARMGQCFSSSVSTVRWSFAFPGIEPETSYGS